MSTRPLREYRKSLREAVIDVVHDARRDGLNDIPELVCFNIALHTNPHALTDEQAERFVTRMKRLISVCHVQRSLKV